jgi:enterochelin esterase family protein
MKPPILSLAVSVLLLSALQSPAQNGPLMRTFEYDSAGSLKATTGPGGQRLQVKRDGAGRIIESQLTSQPLSLEVPTPAAGIFLAAADVSLAPATPAPESTPRPAPRPPAPVTKIEAAGKVTFGLRAPQAKSVGVKAQWQKESIPLVRAEGPDGDWSVVVEKVPPGVWEYWFEVDGLNVIDSSNTQIKPQRQPGKSILHIVSTPPAAWDLQDVPHGAVHAHDYLSKSLGKPRELAVYTPPGYENSGDKKYPVLVLQHGSGDNQKTWVDHGKMHWILDNLIAQKKVVPMIVLMIDGHPLGMRPPSRPVPNEDPKDKETREGADRKNFTASAMNAFERDLFEDALPLLESRYRVEKDSAQRGFAGLSMGGEQAINVGLMHPEKFGWIGAFSAEIPKGDIPGKIADIAVAAGPALKLLWIQSGKDDAPKLGQNQKFVELLTQKGLKFHWQLTEGDHSWPIWRGYLVEFLPLVFQPAGK